MQRRNYYVYITTNPGKSVLYTGVTNDLKRRLYEHYNNKGNKKVMPGNTIVISLSIMSTIHIYMKRFTGRKKLRK